MSVVSKFLDDSINKYEEYGYSKHKLSKGIVGITLCAYMIKLCYPIISKCITKKENVNLNENKSNKITTKSSSSDNNNIAHHHDNDNHQMNNEYIGIDENATDAAGDNIIDDTLTIQQIEKVEKLLLSKKKKSYVDASQIGLNKEFIKQLKLLLTIMIPKLICRETILLTIHTLCLISRTFLSIYVASMEGAIVKFIVRKDVRNFAIMLLKWFGIAIPATFVNSMIRYLENKLALSFRTRLVNHSYKLYFKNQTYYRVSNLDGRIENADHRLTEDISTFASSVAHLYSHLTKPCFDLLLIGLALMRSSKNMKANVVSGPILAFIVISTTAHILRIVSPKFGQLVSEEANRYGYLRHIHSRIITNAEEIAFYGGHKVELAQLREAYSRLTVQMNLIFSQRLWFVMLEQFFMKYVWSGTGMIMVSLPILTSSAVSSTVVSPSSVASSSSSSSSVADGISERTQYLTTARNLLISGADAIERLMSSYKEIVSLAGYTHRVAGMLSVFNDTAAGIYDKTNYVNCGNGSGDTTSSSSSSDRNNTAGILEFSNGRPIANGKIIYSSNLNDRSISLINVPVVTPNCDIVVLSLTLCIEPNMHLLITGPNGCGKSSLFRILSGLWPIYNGKLQIPKPIEGKPCMFYIPQRPYLSIGSLRDQIIYPDTIHDMIKKNITEQNLLAIMKMVALEHVVARDSFDVIRDWKDILSGGEKQRMAMARLFYHRPQYALLDECTSAVSIDVENSIYEAIKNAGITLLTISHRPTLWKFHTHILEFDGQGGWEFKQLSDNIVANQKQQNQQNVPVKI